MKPTCKGLQYNFVILDLLRGYSMLSSNSSVAQSSADFFGIKLGNPNGGFM